MQENIGNMCVLLLQISFVCLFVYECVDDCDDCCFFFFFLLPFLLCSQWNYYVQLFFRCVFITSISCPLSHQKHHTFHLIFCFILPKFKPNKKMKINSLRFQVPTLFSTSCLAAHHKYNKICMEKEAKEAKEKNRVETRWTMRMMDDEEQQQPTTSI